MANILRYCGGGNTARSFTPLYETNFHGVKKIYSMIGGSSTYKTSVFKDLINKYDNIEVIYSTIDNDDIECVILKDLSLAVVDGSPLHGYTIGNNNVDILDIRLDSAVDNIKIEAFKDDLEKLSSDFSQCLKNSYIEFEKALKIHDEWEKLYISNMSFEKINSLTERVIDMLLPNYDSNNGSGYTYHRYLGGATPLGSKDFVPNLTEGLKRYLIKGKPGTGKSTMLKKIEKAAISKNYDIEMYHCGFDPQSIDMIICRELGFAIFDSTAPHEYFPDKDSDEVIDTYKESVELNVDDIYKEELKALSSSYKYQVSKGVEYLSKGKIIKDKIDNIYDSAFNETIGNILIQASLKF